MGILSTAKTLKKCNSGKITKTYGNLILTKTYFLVSQLSTAKATYGRWNKKKKKEDDLKFRLRGDAVCSINKTSSPDTGSFSYIHLGNETELHPHLGQTAW